MFKKTNERSGRLAIAYGMAHGGKTLLWGFVDSFFVFFCIYALKLEPVTATLIATAFFVFEALLQPFVAIGIQRFYARNRSMAIWVRWSALISCILFPLLFWPWSFEAQPLVLALMIVIATGFHAAFTCVDVPLNASIGRFEPDSRNRTLVSAIRNLAGTMARFALALMTALWLEPQTVLDIGRFPWAATGVAAFAGALIIGGFEFVDAKARLMEPGTRVLQARLSAIPWRHLITPNFLVLVTVNIAFLAMISQFDRALIFIISTEPQGGVKFSHVWLMMSAFGAVAGFFWLGLAARFEKSNVAVICLGAFALVAIAFLWLPAGLFWFMVFVMALAFTGTINPIIWAMLPDVMDEVSLKAGYPAHAAVTGIFTLVGKLAIGAGQLICGFVLQANGFPFSPQVQSYYLTIVAISVTGAIIACVVLVFYRLTHEAHGVIIKTIRNS